MVPKHGGPTKLSYAKAMDIRVRRLRGERSADLAKEYDVHPSTIWLITTWQTWKGPA